jgi:hypothetical protein
LLALDPSFPVLLAIPGLAFRFGEGGHQHVTHSCQVLGGQGKDSDPGQPLRALVSDFSKKAYGLGQAKDLLHQLTQGLARKIKYLHDNPTLMIEMGNNGREWAMKPFTQNHYKKKIMNILNKLGKNNN